MLVYRGFNGNEVQVDDCITYKLIKFNITLNRMAWLQQNLKCIARQEKINKFCHNAFQYYNKVECIITNSIS
jgi:hypothetical protein